MNDFCDVSVVIPCYNCSATVKRSYDSIATQTLLPREIIFVNDCSNDDTLQVLVKLKNSSPLNIKIISLAANSGPSVARNAGMDQASSQFIAFLDADDTWCSTKLKIQISVMTSNPSVILSGHFVRQFSAVNIDHSEGFPRIKKLSYLKMLFKNSFNTPSVMIRNVGYRFPPAYRYAEDFALWLHMARSDSHVVLIEQVMAFVHKPFYGHSGLSRSLSLLHKYERQVLLDQLSFAGIYFIPVVAAVVFSEIKYLKRVLVVRIKSVLFLEKLLGAK